MTLLIIIVIGCLLFFGGGIIGWIFNIIGYILSFFCYILSFFFDGCMHIVGCLFWVIVVFIALVVLFT